MKQTIHCKCGRKITASFEGSTLKIEVKEEKVRKRKV